MDDGAHARPRQVPEGAVWVAEADEWREGAVDSAGARQGLHRTWRPDGTLRDEATFVDGRSEGHYRRFHPSGEVAREGELRGGDPQGTLYAFASDAPTAEPLRSCCVPPNAWQLQTDYERGQVVALRWYNRGGVQILENGEPRPPHPATVPPQAGYDEGARQWVLGAFDAAYNRTGHWRRWSTEGVLVEEENLDAGLRHGLWRRFRAEDGALELEIDHVHGARHGRSLNLALAPDSYQDARAAAEEGTFERDRAVAAWTLRDAGGQVIVTRDLGVAPDDDALARSPALADGDGVRSAAAAAAFAALARTLEAERRVGESILAMARSAAATGDDRPLRAWLGRVVWPRSATTAQEIAAAAADQAGSSLAALLDALLRGGDAAALLRAIASVATAHRAALDLVDAALMLAPDRPACRVTRALVHIHLGSPERAAADARSLPEDWEEQRKLLLDYARVVFPVFDFWPARTAVETTFQDAPSEPAQTLDAIRAVVAKYATRIGLVRAEVVRRMGGDAPAPGAAWLPPDLGALLPAGPVALGAWRFQQSFEAEEPGAPAVVEEIAVDEAPALKGQSIPALLRLARGDWASLCWLCWSAGLDRVALPETLSPPASFGAAAAMSVERTWRCRDRLTSGGLVAMSRGVPGFEWEGLPIDLMPRILAEIVTEEMVETRALYSWLIDATAESPWQNDLRESG
jgi:antitoxin component YwqK of YwqJK toxin-antitoxin module